VGRWGTTKTWARLGAGLLQGLARGALRPAPALLAAAAWLLGATGAMAVPSFAQQTGQPCAACHVGAFGPQLKPYGRDFKLFGYQSADGKSHVPPVAATAMTSFTHTQEPQSPNAAPDFAANDNFAVDQISLYYAGAAPGGVGVFAQGTYKVIEIGDKDLVLGLDFNNSPGVQDAWNSTPVWAYPYNGSPLASAPAAATLIDGPLQHLVAGAGAYVFWDYSLYAEVTTYLPLDRVLAGRLGEGANSQSDRYGAVIPYWRLAVNHDFGGASAIEVGTYGLSAQRFPGGLLAFGPDTLTDRALDANIFAQLDKTRVLSAHATWIHEDQDLKASSQLLGARSHDALDTRRVDLSWSFRDTWTPTAQFFKTTGSADPALYGGPRGSPNSAGYVLELAYVGEGKPSSAVLWANWRAALQYVGYERFDGARQGAPGHDAIYLSLWLAAAPFGALVSR
jgi:hypothetical protein